MRHEHPSTHMDKYVHTHLALRVEDARPVLAFKLRLQISVNLDLF